MKKYVFILVCLVALSCKDDAKKNDHQKSDSAAKLAAMPQPLVDLINQSKKDSDNIDLQLKIVNSLDSIALYKDALQQMDRVIKTDSLNQTYWLMRGRLSNKVKDTATALKCFSYAARIYPTAESLMELADVLSLTKNPKALIVCDDIMKMNPGHNYDDKAYFFKGMYYSKLNDKKNAILFFDKCIGQNYHFADAYIEKGYLYFIDKNYAAALQIFVQLTNVNPANADGYYWQAKCKEALNKKDEAIALYKKALEFDASIKEAKEAIARLTVRN
ncbi:MAG: tetratricopeptide repeat protein [Bacteroidetes bacterium]|nr:tetratricopeptide repeat protein [Bacteroidota bacterium]